jgi:hypothetical protein
MPFNSNILSTLACHDHVPLLGPSHVRLHS